MNYFPNRIGPPDRMPIPVAWQGKIDVAIRRYYAILRHIGPLHEKQSTVELLHMLLTVECHQDRAFWRRMASWHPADMLAAAMVEIARDEWFKRQMCWHCGNQAVPGLLTCVKCTVVEYADHSF